MKIYKLLILFTSIVNGLKNKQNPKTNKFNFNITKYNEWLIEHSIYLNQIYNIKIIKRNARLCYNRIGTN